MDLNLPPLDAKVLGELLLMQSVVINLPDDAVSGFVTRGLSDMPGVDEVRHVPNHEEDAAESYMRFPLAIGDGPVKGELLFAVSDPDAFEPYIPYVENFCFMLAVILEERKQRGVIKRHAEDLEHEVEKRTKELEASEARLKLAAESGGLGLWEWRVDQDRAVVSDYWLTIKGLSREEYTEGFDQWIEGLHPDEKDNALAQLDLHLKGETDHFDVEYRFWRPNHGWYWEQAIAKVMERDRDGKPLRMLGYHQDITERKETELKLRETMALLQAAMDNSTAGIAIADAPDGRLRYVNDAGLGIRAGDKSELLNGVDIQAYVSSWQIHYLDGTPYKPEDVPLARAIINGERVKEEFNIKRPNDEWRTVLASAAPILDDKGRVVAGIVVFLDITERKRAEEALAESERRLREVVAKTPHPLCIVDTRTHAIEYLNEAFSEVFGYTLEDVGHVDDWWETVFPDRLYWEKIKQSWSVAIEDGAVTKEAAAPREWRLLSKDGSERDVEFRLMPLGDISILSLTDLTQHRDIQKALNEAKLAAEASNRSKSEFLANMSHEIRTPLNGVLGMLQLLKTTHLDSSQLEYIDMAAQAGTRLTRLLGDILDLSKVEVGKLEVVSEHFDFVDLMHAIKDLFVPVASQSDLDFYVKVDPAIPRNVYGDPTRIHQVLGNLIGNALKFTEAGHVSVEANLVSRTGPQSCRVLFIIEDTGVGIPDDELDTLFEAFTQAEVAYRRKHQGAGLGLAITRQLVKLLGGNIAVDSEPGVGTTLYVTLPLRCVAGSEKAAEETNERAAEKKLTVLVAEDDAGSKFAISQQLEMHGHHPYVVETGRDVLEQLQAGNFDLVLMDVQMPVMDGVEATRLIRQGEAGKRYVDIPIIAMTAYAMRGDRERFLDTGMDGYLAKPVDMNELQEEIGKVLEARAQKP